MRRVHLLRVAEEAAIVCVVDLQEGAFSRVLVAANILPIEDEAGSRTTLASGPGRALGGLALIWHARQPISAFAHERRLGRQPGPRVSHRLLARGLFFLRLVRGRLLLLVFIFVFFFPSYIEPRRIFHNISLEQLPEADLAPFRQIAVRLKRELLLIQDLVQLLLRGGSNAGKNLR